jgi:hypothetical protein
MVAMAPDHTPSRPDYRTRNGKTGVLAKPSHSRRWRMVPPMGHSILFEPVQSPFLVDDSFHIDKAPTEFERDPGKAPNVEALEEAVAKLAKLQGKLYAHDQYAVLLVFQAMDAAGKDGTIKAVMSGVNPQGCEVTSFKQPSTEELDHDFLWRCQRRVPERGRIGISSCAFTRITSTVRSCRTARRVSTISGLTASNRSSTRRNTGRATAA